MAFSEELGKKIWDWRLTATKAKQYANKEMALRKEIANALFPEPKEGVNTKELPDDWKIKLTYKYNRTLDEAALPAVIKELGEWAKDQLVKEKPSLVLAAYKKLTPEQKLIFDEAVIQKPASPSLELIEPKALPEE